MSRSVLLAVVAAFLALTFSAPASAQLPLTTITFDELPQQPADRLSINGLSFSSVDALYGGAGPGTTVWVQDPSLEGSASEALTLTFARPTTVLEFGVARACICTLSVGATVELYAPGAAARPVARIELATTPLLTFSEALFRYSGAAIQRAVITFPSAELAERFAIDNVTYHRGNG